MMITIVDRNDNEIGAKVRGSLLPTDIYRVANLWITNDHKQILISKRSQTKKHNPGKWAPAVNGTVEAHETYETNIVKEAKEELGIEGYKFTSGPKYYSDKSYLHFTQTFLLNLNWSLEKFNPDKKEIAELKWISVDDLLEDLIKRPNAYIGSMPLIMDAIYGVN